MTEKSHNKFKKAAEIFRLSVGVFLSASFIVPSAVVFPALSAEARSADRGSSGKPSIPRRENAAYFNAFLERCTDLQRISLIQALGALPEIQKAAYGHLSTTAFGVEVKLEAEEAYDDEERPKTYNQVPPELVLEAEKQGFLDKSLWSVDAVKKEFLWKAHHWVVYLFSDPNKIEYHEVVEWLAQKKSVVGKPVFTDEQIADMTTHELAGAVSAKFLEKKFSDFWEELNEEKRGKMLEELEKKRGTRLSDFQKNTLCKWEKASQEDKERVCRELNEKLGTNADSSSGVYLAAGMGGASVALGGLGITASVMGFAFYTTLTSAMCSAAAAFGATLPFSAYLAATTTASVAAGPVGWCVAGALLLSAPFVVGWADEDACAQFVYTQYMIETQMLEDGR